MFLKTILVLGILLISCSLSSASLDYYPNIRPFDDSIYPVEISGKFGAPRTQSMGGDSYQHTGVDYKLEKGTNLVATAKGKVIFAEDSEAGYGNLVKIDHENGLVTFYAHLLRVDVKEGDKVEKGQIIGKVGRSGRATGYHVHYEIRRGNVPLPPRDFIF